MAVASGRYVSHTGHEYRQLFQEFPVLEPIFLDFEKSYVSEGAMMTGCAATCAFAITPCAAATQYGLVANDWAQNNWNVAFASCGLYLAFCVVGRALMKSRPAFDLQWCRVAARARGR
jgi:hypothetical protein